MCPSDYNRFSDRARYLLKIIIFHTPLAFDAIQFQPFGTENLEWLGYQMAKFSYQMGKKFRRYLCSFWRNSRT